MRNTSYIVLLLIIIFLSCTKKEPDGKLPFGTDDSLISYLTSANDLELSLEKRVHFNQKAFEIAKRQASDSMNHVYLFRVANRYYNMNKLAEYKNTVQFVLQKSEKSKDTFSLAKAYTYFGDYYSSQSVRDSAFYYYTKAEKKYNDLQDNRNLAKSLLNKAVLQNNENDFSGCETSIFNALRKINKETEKDIVYDAYNLLGIVSNETGEYERALEFHNKALKVLENIEESIMPAVFQSKASSLNNIGCVYQNSNRNHEAVLFFKKGLIENNLLKDKPVVYAMLLDNLGYSKFKLKDNSGLPELFYQSLKLRDSLQLTDGIITSKVHLSEYFASLKDTVKAIRYCKEALVTARESKSQKNVLEVLEQLMSLEPENAIVYNKEYIQINDSIQKIERNMGDKFSRIAFETEEVKIQNAHLNQKFKKLIFLFLLIVTVGLLVYNIKTQKSKNLDLEYKHDQQVVNEQIYNMMISQQTTVEGIRLNEKQRVAQELHDGVLGRLFGVRMNLDGLNCQNDLGSIEQRGNYIDELKNIEQIIREISHDLNKEKSDLINNFVAIVIDLLEKQKKISPANLTYSIDPSINWDEIGITEKINLYRIVQESLQNNNKYANANQVQIEFKKQDQELFLTIQDDGIGFDINKGKKGIGLQNMIARTKECKGVFEVKTSFGNGTLIQVKIPLKKDGANNNVE